MSATRRQAVARPPAAESTQATLFGTAPDDPGEPASAPSCASPNNRLRQGLDAVLAEGPADWQSVLAPWRASPAGQAIATLLDQRLAAGACLYPAQPLRALALTPRSAVRVVILGQDPYHGPGQAEGLAFSVPPGCKRPPSLRNIDAELQRDLGLAPPAHGHLGDWARQGVLLLNTSLTVEDGLPASHAGQGWEALTDALIEATARDPGPKAYLLWGAHAQAKATLIERAGAGRHLLLRANHPSPLSARRPPVPFLGCGHFSRAQAWVREHRPGEAAPDWRR